MTTEEVFDSLYNKGNEWKHEKEYRVVYYEKSCNSQYWKKIDSDIFLLAPVKRIIFGLAAEMDDYYLDALNILRNHINNGEKIDITKCKLMSNKYQLGPDKQFDLLSEIEYVKKNSKQQVNNSNALGHYKFEVDSSGTLKISER